MRYNKGEVLEMDENASALGAIIDIHLMGNEILCTSEYEYTEIVTYSLLIYSQNRLDSYILHVSENKLDSCTLHESEEQESWHHNGTIIEYLIIPDIDQKMIDFYRKAVIAMLG